VVAVATSGGGDSTALLHAVLHAAKPLGLRVAALHVHHGLMPQADEWAARVQRRCAAWRVRGWPLECLVERLATSPAAGESIEAWARRERYRALRRMALQCGASLVLLAHHRRDQAETLLLQVLRGGGPAGLAAMPRSAEREGVVWARPWLDLPADAIQHYLARYRLAHVDDASNADNRFARSRLRQRIWPELLRQFPYAEAALAHAATRAQEADAALRELAAIDAAAARAGDTDLSIAMLAGFSPARRANLLRSWLRGCMGRGAPDSLIGRLVDEACAAAAPARWPAPPGWVQRYRGVLRWWAGEAAAVGAAPASDVFDWSQPGDYPLPALAACVQVRAVRSGGVPAALLQGCRLQARQGGERFQHPGGIARSLKKAFQAAGIAAWQREAPLVFSGDRLLYVPGLGIDARCIAEPGRPRRQLEWVKLGQVGHVTTSAT
jgi:tRNA(Ile)-lysidine synthase